MSQNNLKSKRLYGIDFLRIIAIIIIFIGHSAIQFNCNYSFLSPLINLRVPAMTLFFMLSGFVLYVTYGRTNLFSQEKLKEYYVKRAIGIIPTYYLIAIVYIVFCGKESLVEVLKLLPLELTVMQATLPGLEYISHNGGTWFVSCLIIAYFLYPFLQELLKMVSIRLIFFLGVGVSCFLGIILSAIVINLEKYKDRYQLTKYIILFLVILFFWYGYGLEYGDKLYTIMLSMLIIAISMINWNFIEKIHFLKKIVLYMSSIAYEFFLAQFFVWKIAGEILLLIGIDGNKSRIIVSFMVCMFLASVLHYGFTKPVGRYIKKKIWADI